MHAQLEATRSRSYIIAHDNVYKFYWDVLIIILACYNAIALPLQIAFNEIQEYYDQSRALEGLEISVDIIFLVDIILSFFQSYIDVLNGETYSQPNKICKNYCRKGFLFDFISTTPILLRSLVKGDKALEQMVTLFRLLKLTRVRRLSKLIRNCRCLTLLNVRGGRI